MILGFQFHHRQTRDAMTVTVTGIISISSIIIVLGVLRVTLVITVIQCTYPIHNDTRYRFVIVIIIIVISVISVIIIPMCVCISISISMCSNRFGLFVTYHCKTSFII